MDVDHRQSPRDALFACLEQLVESDSSENATSNPLEVMRQIGPEAYIDALHEIMESEPSKTQLVACCNMITSKPGTALARRAVWRLQDILQHGTPDLQRYAAYQLFFTGTATSEMVSVLEKVFDRQEANDNRKLWVAGALLHAAEPTEEQGDILSKAMRALFAGLRSDDPYSVIIAAMAFGRKQIHQEEITKSILRVYHQSDAGFRQVILGQFAKLGAHTSEVIDLLAAVAQSGDESLDIRTAAIVSLARMPSEIKAIDDVMFNLVYERDWQIMFLACSALSARRTRLPDTALEQLGHLLSDPDPNLRGASAMSLSELGSQIEPLFPQLIERLEVEEDSSVLDAIITAVSSVGALALPLLAKTIPSVHLRSVQVFQYALLEIGRIAPRELAECLSSPEQRTRQAVAWAIQSLGPGAEPAVQVMEPLLRSNDKAFVRDTLIAFGRIGPAGRTAARSLGQLLLDADSVIREWAEQAVMSIGFEAIAALEALRLEAEDESQPIFDRMLKRLTHAVPHVIAPTPVGVEGITDDDDLNRFAIVGKLISDHGPMSFRKLEAAIEEMKKTDQAPADLTSSAGQLRTTIDRLEEALTTSGSSRVRLLDRGKNRKGGLTERGRSFLRKVVQYLGRNTQG